MCSRQFCRYRVPIWEYLTDLGGHLHVARVCTFFILFLAVLLSRRDTVAFSWPSFVETMVSHRKLAVSNVWTDAFLSPSDSPFVTAGQTAFRQANADRPSLPEHKSVCSVSSVARMICVFCYAIVHMLARHGKTTSRKPREGHVRQTTRNVCAVTDFLALFFENTYRRGEFDGVWNNWRWTLKSRATRLSLLLNKGRFRIRKFKRFWNFVNM